MKKSQKLSEPEATYSTSIRKFDSFEQMNEADAKEMADISAVDHLRNTVHLIRKIFSEELKRPMNKRIKFK